MAVMAKAQLAAVLRDMAERIEQGDSFEGSIDYTCMERGLGEDEFVVRFAYRIGNSGGQGGMRVSPG